MKIRYFGTDLKCAGHYIWDVVNGNVYNRNLGLKDLEFCPESFFKSHERKGLTRYAVFGNTTVFGICGSPVDKRGGCKSVFFVDGILSEQDIKNLLLKNEFFKKLIEIMEVQL